MLVQCVKSSIIIPSSELSSLLLLRRRGRRELQQPTWAKRPNSAGAGEGEAAGAGAGAGEGDGEKPTSSLRVSKAFLARCAVAVSGLGFLDAGYSGDWSRIGVISKEDEELLRFAAFLIIPLCIVLIFSISEENNTP
ncbi:uncharacterized protein LOC109721730 isoform X1 [Ananas comosus]|uniref:Uncharacterized protein LOC109721730 isoform X1 n=1 Tax=Ananas comosus TaxID=4615 RepID=A0A6P5GIE6_ANACO|nr:uncharacterized protein LOC109721730 isoform X1 [Ananas comosus]